MVTDNKKIAKNTLFLYIRMLLLIVVTFYTTRVVLQALGVSDFGLYNVIAGFVSMMAFINTSLSNSIQRFLNFELGKGEKGKVGKYFSVSIASQLFVSIIILLFAETMGVWFLNSKMTIPEDKVVAANFVFQVSVLMLVVKILQAPFYALIIAKEKMQFYAYVTLFEVILQLGVAYIMLLNISHKLEWYSFFLFVVVIFTFFSSVVYSTKMHKGISLKPLFDKEIFKEVYSFSGWNLFGAASGVLMNQGVNILINIFFNVIVNAAREISFQVIAGVQRFISSFQLALNPQIVQSYASNNRSRYLALCYTNFKVSFYLTWIIVLPLLLCCNDVLKLWLNRVPQYTVEFVKIALLCGLVEALGSAISVPMYATGKIRSYQVIVSVIKILSLPVVYLLFTLDYPPVSSLYICLLFDIMAQFARVKIWTKLVDDSVLKYFRTIILPGIIIVLVTYYVGGYINDVFESVNSFVKICVSFLVTIFMNLVAILFIGVNSQERSMIYSVFNKIVIWKRKL